VPSSCVDERRKVFYYMFCCCLCAKRKSRTKHHNPPFTSQYIVRLSPDEMVDLSDEQRDSGWQIIPDKERGGIHHIMVKMWMQPGECRGRRHNRGELMLTWQVIDEHDLCTYRMVDNPTYADAVSALHEGAARVRSLRCAACVSVVRVC
jgi:hypothetical protein